MRCLILSLLDMGVEKKVDVPEDPDVFVCAEVLCCGTVGVKSISVSSNPGITKGFSMMSLPSSVQFLTRNYS
jgi:hypothetical protein